MASSSCSAAALLRSRRHVHLSVSLALLLLGTAGFPSALSAQETLQFNVPYHCTDGTDKVITQCKPWKTTEICYWRNERNGTLINEVFNVRSQMDGWLAICKVQKPASAAAASSTQAAGQPAPSTLVATPSGRIAAGLNPPYLNNLPSAETVKKLIQGSDPTDTLERQVAVFNDLGAIIQHHLAADRTRNQLTPDEVKVTYAYNLAAYELEQGYKKTHTAEEAQAFVRRHGQYEMDSAINQETNSRLLSATAVAENRQNDASAFQQLQQHNEAIVRQNEEAKARAEAAAKAGPGGLSNDPTAVATRRCLELGGAQLECVGKGFGKGLLAMIGVDSDAIGVNTSRTGLMIAGTYRDASGANLTFSEGGLTLGSCGKLIPLGLNYAIAKRGTSLVLQTTNQPRPFTLVLGPEGGMTGPGATDVQGQIIVGYHTYTVYTRRVSDNQIVGQHQEQEPVYGPKLERCTLGALRSTGAVAAGTLANLLPALLATMGGNGASANVKTYPAGPRMVGSYEGPGGLKIEFQPEGAVVDCQQAHAARPYTVENTATAINVTIGGAGSPIALTLQADGSLVGRGSADVAGRLVAGMAGNDVAFQPTRASCAVAKLTPQPPKRMGLFGM